MAKKSVRGEWHLAWDVIRGLPEYKKDFQRMSKTKKCNEKMVERWSFFPLDDPENENPSLEFYVKFMSYCEKDPLTVQAVDFSGWDKLQKYKGVLYDEDGNPLKKQSLPYFVPIGVRLTAPIYKIKEEIEALIIYLHDMYGIKPEKYEREGLGTKHYLVEVMVRAGCPKKEIYKKVMSERIKKLKYNDPFKLAERRVIKRIIEKHDTKF